MARSAAAAAVGPGRRLAGEGLGNGAAARYLSDAGRTHEE